MKGNIVRFNNQSSSPTSIINIVSLRFRVTNPKSGYGYGTQFSQFGFYDNNDNKYQWPSGTTWSTDVQYYEFDPINANNKITLSATPCIITINLPSGIHINANTYCQYGWYTANDAPERDPVSWELFISKDGTNYLAADARVNQTITDTRYALAFKGTYALPRF